MADRPYQEYIHEKTKVLARQVEETVVIRTDRGKIVLHPGDWEIIDEDGTRYANTDEKFQKNYTKG